VARSPGGRESELMASFWIGGLSDPH